MPFVGTFGRIGGELEWEGLGKWFLGISWWSPPEPREGTVERYFGGLPLEGMAMGADRESGAPKLYG
jgi:hypothetical protein